MIPFQRLLWQHLIKPGIYVVVKTLLIYPISACAVIIHNTMTHERLSSFCINTKKFHVDNVITKFAQEKGRRLALRLSTFQYQLTFYCKHTCKLPKYVLYESKNVILYEVFETIPGPVCVLAKMVTLRPSTLNDGQIKFIVEEKVRYLAAIFTICIVQSIGDSENISS